MTPRMRRASLKRSGISLITATLAGTGPASSRNAAWYQRRPIDRAKSPRPRPAPPTGLPPAGPVLRCGPETHPAGPKKAALVYRAES